MPVTVVYHRSGGKSLYPEIAKWFKDFYEGKISYIDEETGEKKYYTVPIDYHELFIKDLK